RAGTTTKYWFGDRDEDFAKAGWWGLNSDNRTHSVGKLNENPFGLFDTHGNVWEWVQDGWNPADYVPFQNQPAVDPIGPFYVNESSTRVHRGGNFFYPAHCRSSARNAYLPESRLESLGFRVALTIEAVKAAANGRPPESPTVNSSWHGWPAAAPAPAIAPFDATQAKRHQEAWAKYLGVPVEYTNSIGMKFRLIPPGEFMMGSTPDEIQDSLQVVADIPLWKDAIVSEGPQHRVILSKPIYLGIHEVSQSQYERVVGTNPAHFSAAGSESAALTGTDSANLPIEMVSWNDAAQFSATLSQLEGRSPSYFRNGTVVTPLTGNGYSLPTEAEWEFSCRAGTATRYSNGDLAESLPGWCVSNSAQHTHKVGELPPNPLGLHDMHGNVREWVQDGWEPDYFNQIRTDVAVNPSGAIPPGKYRVFRGGNWSDHPSHCRASHRRPEDAAHSDNHLGLRLKLAVAAVKAAIGQRNEGTSPAAIGRHGWPADAPPPAIAPFDATQAKAHQEAWAKYLGVPVEYTNTIGMKFRLIPPGEFLMGSTPEEIEAAIKHHTPNAWDDAVVRSEGPQHRVILTKPFYLCAYEVTQEEYEMVLGRNPSEFSESGKRKDAVAGMKTNRHPVDAVSWSGAVDFCVASSERDGLLPNYLRNGLTTTLLKGNGYRLPTEAEWEFACRAGTTTMWWSGSGPQDYVQAGWFGGNSGDRTHVVGELDANPFGLFDVHGNVREHCQDWFSMSPYPDDALETVMDPLGPKNMIENEGNVHVVRGGAACYAGNPTSGRSTSRRHSGNSGGIGMRPVLHVESVRNLLKAKQAPSVTTPSDPPRKRETSWHGWPADAPPPAIAPFNTAQAKAHQEAWAKYLGVPVEFTNSIGITFRLIPPGEFLMGTPAEEAEQIIERHGIQLNSAEEIVRSVRSESPPHRVTLTQPFYFSTSEITIGQFQSLSPDDLTVHPAAAGSVDVNLPISTNWNAAARFGNQLGDKAGLDKLYDDRVDVVSPVAGDFGYRLPTEAEWEFACRAGTTTRYWTGDDTGDMVKVEWRGHNSDGKPHPVGQRLANPFGLHDMHGNLMEWCHDAYADDTYARRQGAPVVDPVSPFATFTTPAVLRGGDFGGNNDWDARAAKRRPLTRAPGKSPLDGVGIRLRLSVDAVRHLQPRTVVQAALDMNGYVEGTLNDHPVHVDREDADKLRQRGELKVLAITLRGGPGITNEGLSRIANLPDLEHLSITGFGLDDRGLENLGNLPQLKSLYLEGGRQTTKSLKTIGCWAQIEHLTVHGIPFSDEHLEGIEQLQQLQTIRAGHLVMTEAQTQAFSKLPNLKFMWLMGEHLTDDTLRNVARLPALTAFTVTAADQSRITNDGARALAANDRIVYVNLGGTKIDDQGLAYLAARKNWEDLLLDGTRITDDGLNVLKDMPRLRTLWLSNTKVGDSGLATIATLPALEVLHLNQTHVTDSGLIHLEGLQHLKDLRLDETRVTAQQVDQLRKKLPNCRISAVQTPSAASK
ncbi:MAG: SUMF1/EgtB/PvdO family nonheme iron enzyme, partial [Rhodopirellula sp.]|nr:SUMF1/EgtB/PvdO family nonheme iron enzyme [Rhodopirellula sp.]